MSTPSSTPRHLAPAPSSRSPLRSTTNFLASAGSQRGIRRASTACSSCKQIKRKCDQAHPCSNCRKSNTPCIYNVADDGRRKAARKRSVESLELKRDALDSILESFRTSNEEHAQRLLYLIRTDAPLDDIVHYASSHIRDLPNGFLPSISSLTNGSAIRKHVMSVVALCDTPLFEVPANPWTRVTAADDLVSHLISVFFTWYHTAYPTVDQDLFIRDMTAAKLDCQFCSPLLVNAILAVACHFSDQPRACQVPSDASTRGQHFFDEAVRLWNTEEGRPSLLNIQACSLIALAACLAGKDRLSWSYIENTNRIGQELTLKTNRARKLGHQAPSEEHQRSVAICNWTAFSLTVGYGIAFMKAVSDETPSVPRPASFGRLPRNQRWIPYPYQVPEVMVELGDLQTAYYDLHEVGMDIQNVLFGNKDNDPTPEPHDLNDRLIEWHKTLPATLQLDDQPTVINPPVMDLQYVVDKDKIFEYVLTAFSLTYHWFRISLFNFLKTPSAALEQKALFASSTSSDMRTTGTKISPTPLTTRTNVDARNQVLESAKAIAALCTRFARDYGLKQPTMWMPQSTASAAYSIIDDLGQPEIQEVFHELCLVLTAASRKWLVMKGHVRMLFLTAETKGRKLPQKTQDLLKFVALDSWGPEDHVLFVSSAYPNYALAKGEEDPRLVAMGDLLSMWADLGIAREDEHITEEGAEELISADNNADGIRIPFAAESSPAIIETPESLITVLSMPTSTTHQGTERDEAMVEGAVA